MVTLPNLDYDNLLSHITWWRAGRPGLHISDEGKYKRDVQEATSSMIDDEVVMADSEPGGGRERS